MEKRLKTDEIDADFVISQVRPQNRELARALKAASAQPQEPEPALKTESPEVAPPVAVSDNETEPQREVKEPTKRKRGPTVGYRDTFLRRNEIKKRQCVYIGYDTHALIAKLVRAMVSAGSDISVGGYIDTVLNEHMQTHKEEINEVYRQGQGDLL
jgi:hypothetical protein